MIEDAAYNSLRSFLSKVDSDATLLSPQRGKLSDVIRDNQGGPRPKGPYAMIEFLTDRDVGEVDGECYAEQKIANEDRVVLSKRRAVELLFRVHLFAPRPLDFASLLLAGLRTGEPSVWMAPFVIRDLGEATRAPEMIQQKAEGRAHFDVTLGAIATDKLLVDVIETGDIALRGQGGAQIDRNIHYVKP